MATGDPALYADFSGGVNKEAGPYLVSENECQDARNVSASPLGSFKKRRGFSRFSQLKNGSTVQLDGAPHSIFPVNLSTKYLLVAGNYYNNSNDAIVRVDTNGAATTLKSNATANTRWEFVQGPVSVVDEIQTVSVNNATGGTFTLTYSGQTTAAIAYNATASALSDALVALSNIAPGDVSVSLSGTIYTITFTGSLGGTNVAQLTANAASLTGTSPTVTITTTRIGATQGPIYGLNGIDDPIQWDGSAASTTTWTATGETTHPAKYCKMLVYNQDKLWAAGDARTGYTGRIYSTGYNAADTLPDPCNWGSDFILDIEPEDGEVITGLGTLGPYVVVFKNRKTYVIDNPAALTYRVVSSSVGCVAPRSVVETSNGTFFLSEDMGVCVTDGTNVTKLSHKIDPLIRNIMQDSAAHVSRAAAVFHENSYYLSVPLNQSRNEITLEYSLDTESWWIHSCASNQFALLDPVGTPRLYSVDPQSIVVHRAFDPSAFYDSTATENVPYESYWKGPYWAWGQPHINKRLSQYRIDGRGTWTVSTASTFDGEYIELDDGIVWENQSASGSTFGGSGLFGDTDLTGSVFGPQAGVSQKRYPTPQKGWGRAWSIQITDEGAQTDLEIYSITAFTRARTD